VLRYAQQVGVSLPLLGTNIQQQLAILNAAEQEQIAVIDLNRIRREKLAALRTAYTEYWGYGDQTNVAQGYITGSQWDLSMGRSLRKAGFYTATNLLDIVTSIQKVQFDVTSFGSLQQAQLAAIDSAVGFEVPSFQPVQPTFFDGCRPDRTLALQSAYDVDPALATLEAETIQVQHELAKVKGSSIQASADLQGGTTTDINHQVSGYNLDAGLNVALPVRSRDEERALRAQYTAELQALAFNEKQQRVTIESTLDATLQNLSSAQTILTQSLSDTDARQNDLRTAVASLTLLRQAPAGVSIDVHAKRNDLYAAQVQASLARENVLLQATDLLLVAPAACGAEFVPIPPFTPPTHPPHKPHTKKGATPSPTPSV
jgi:hypothetical protein